MRLKRRLILLGGVGALLLALAFGGVKYFRYCSKKFDREIENNVHFIESFGIFGTKPCGNQIKEKVSDLDQLIESYHKFDASFVASIRQSYVQSLAVGDIDNDGENELLSGTAPDSRLYIHKYDKKTKAFRTELLEERLAGFGCDETKTNVAGGVGNIIITDINQDGTNEIVAMTDQQLEDSNTKFLIFSKRENDWYKNSIEVKSSSHWTHGLAAFDVDNDGIKEIFSTHNKGEIFKHKVSRDLGEISYNLEVKLEGSIKGLEITDVFNNGQKKLIAVQGDDKYNTAVKIYGFTREGLTKWPEVCIDSYKERKFWDATTCTGDIDNDEENEMVVGWVSKDNERNLLTLVAYKFNRDGEIIQYFPLIEDSSIFGSCELRKKICIGNIRNDKKNRVYVSSSRGDEHWTNTKFNERWGLYEIEVRGIEDTLTKKIANFNHPYITGTNIIIGDIDNDRKNELVIGSGKGRSAQHNKESYILFLK